MWNFKGTLWNPTQNILRIHWKMFVEKWRFKSTQIYKLISIFETSPRTCLSSLKLSILWLNMTGRHQIPSASSATKLTQIDWVCLLPCRTGEDAEILAFSCLKIYVVIIIQIRGSRLVCVFVFPKQQLIFCTFVRWPSWLLCCEIFQVWYLQGWF